MEKPLLVNLSMLLAKPTGIANYVINILPYFDSLEYISLVAKQYYQENIYKNPYFVSEKYSPDYGSKGHFLRLLWTQLKVPNIYQQSGSNLLFSPVPEMPLFSKVKSVIMVHDLIPLRFPKKNSPLTPYFRYYIPQVCQQAEHIICNSKATADDIINFFGINADKITPIYLGYNPETFKVIDKIKPINKKPFFLYLGRHDPHKNVERIVSAFAQFKHHQEYELWLAGPTDSRYTPLLKQQTKELNITHLVKFLDYVKREDLPIILNQAQALIFPTLWEGFGFPVLEAIASGTPVITSNISSLPEVVGDAGILVNPLEVKEIASAMNLMAEDDKLRQQLRELGLKQAQKFSWQKTAQATIELLSNVR
ncbi:glycosyltransferase family 1 protein [Cyanobacterium aponinum UTEX 3222]|uniref:Glycosyltransferase family 1 protein n=1 Tax=Cyanobacterium aponinum AL20115 TaxID=3090662 RepID=A0AAF1C2W4_9CHRO|nr:glycosyltransferase family 1 protein [Cyanobacterium aponinum]PHV62924.1 mannosyltransferase [Cyanobacterium aponinum IPPAS B-1201]WPF90142.1 glycosyltransferase family 1 protein [Cyanobacterium aponinum AL20115]WRL37539.1 glycosyltransferase family 1 protein [Cyanobacterium aponinum UTEX 3221]WRL41106.1 glycosyltransferase family 1 protein [Cyanobacterium aponinum UTEX 3222]